jgi:ABC-type sugar transport system substrate-binding protein
MMTLAGCGSSASGTTDASKQTTASSAGVARARAFMAAHTAAPTSILVTKPLSAVPPRGKSIVYLGPTSTSVTIQAAAVKAAAAKLGWTVHTLVFPQTPEGAASAMMQAVQVHPDAVLQAGFPVAVFPNEVKKLSAEHIPYVDNGTTDTQAEGVTASIAGVADYVARGQYLANWVVADSSGHANVVDFNLSTYPTVDALSTTFGKTLGSLCPACTVAVQDVEGTSIGTTLPSQIVQYLQAHPNVNYVLATYGDMTIGLPQALAAAHLSGKVKVVSQSGSLQQLTAGQEAVNVPESDSMIGWLMVDAAARAMLGDPVTEAYYQVLPHNFVTKANVGNPSVPYGAVPDFESQFLTLWHLK